jgi:hypothetical protein
LVARANTRLCCASHLTASRSKPGFLRGFFKGGWRRSSLGHLVHQVALLERGRRAMAIAVLTEANPSHGYGHETVRGIAARLLRP